MRAIYTGWSDVTAICGHDTISMLLGNTGYCVKLSGEELWRYSNKIESVVSDVTVISIYQSLRHNMAGKTAGIDMIGRNYASVTLCVVFWSLLEMDNSWIHASLCWFLLMFGSCVDVTRTRQWAWDVTAYTGPRYEQHNMHLSLY